jgi:hypothetical protein
VQGFGPSVAAPGLAREGVENRHSFPHPETTEVAEIRTSTDDEIVMTMSVVLTMGVVGYALSASSSVFASFRSGVSKPSVNQP